MTQREPKTATRECRVVLAGRIDYLAAWEWQRRLAADRSAGRGGDTLLLLEHPPTISLGRAADRSNILVAPDELARRGVALVESDRGGDVTYHAPGQLVGYPILKLSHYGGGLLRYLRGLEETLIRVLASYGIEAGRVPDLTGVWVRTTDAADYDAKVAAIGVRLSASGITSHGFALNIAPDLRGFDQIIPCGIRHRRVTSLEHLLGSSPPLAEVAERLIAQFAEVFEARLMLEEQAQPWLNLSP
jgi:lipoyl(octanoyl) transferase